MLKGKFAIVTGAASKRGIGRATAVRFAQNGATVAILDLDADAAKAAAKELGEHHIGLACDVAKPGDCAAAVMATLTAFGQVDILINNAGVSQSDKLMEITQENFDLVIDVSLRGTLNMCQALAPHFRDRRDGRVVNLGSIAAQRGGGLFGGPHYSAAKGAVHSLTKSLARELGPDGIRVNAIAPGTIDTDIFQGKLTNEQKHVIVSNIPLGRLGTSDDVACACLYLVSDLAAYVTGTILDVNGGRFMH